MSIYLPHATRIRGTCNVDSWIQVWCIHLDPGGSHQLLLTPTFKKEKILTHFFKFKKTPLFPSSWEKISYLINRLWKTLECWRTLKNMPHQSHATETAQPFTYRVGCLSQIFFKCVVLRAHLGLCGCMQPRYYMFLNTGLKHQIKLPH